MISYISVRWAHAHEAALKKHKGGRGGGGGGGGGGTYSAEEGQKSASRMCPGGTIIGGGQNPAMTPAMHVHACTL